MIDGSLDAAANRVAQWVATSGDNEGMPYVIIDKAHAEVFVFDAQGQLLGQQPALLGMEKGDVAGADIGQRALKNISPKQRITPAGRFISSLARDEKGQEILWIDYDTALALHPVVKGTPQENRAARLSSPTREDNRISYGCVNVPAAFYHSTISTTFASTDGVVYILPESADPIEWFTAAAAKRDR